MTDLNENEIEALKAAVRGAIGTASALESLRENVMALDPRADISTEDLEQLERVTLAHAVSSQALRGFVESMRARRA